MSFSEEEEEEEKEGKLDEIEEKSDEKERPPDETDIDMETGDYKQICMLLWWYCESSNSQKLLFGSSWNIYFRK